MCQPLLACMYILSCCCTKKSTRDCHYAACLVPARGIRRREYSLWHSSTACLVSVSTIPNPQCTAALLSELVLFCILFCFVSIQRRLPSPPWPHSLFPLYLSHSPLWTPTRVHRSACVCWSQASFSTSTSSFAPTCTWQQCLEGDGMLIVISLAALGATEADVRVAKETWWSCTPYNAH